MATIQELSATLANQIAAGEVIERPASVVKELVENAIDAGATKIDILVEEAGINKIEVIDNGEGIAADQVTKAFLRHATSKIVDRNDLFRIQTLGFRGEALPSIASIADVILETAEAGAEQGKQVHYRGGELLSETGASARVGTHVIVTDLFFNTPARLKYLKTPQTELTQIVDIVNRLALSYPQIAFNLQHNGNKQIRTVGNGNLQQVLAEIYGVQQARKMLAFAGENTDYRIHGFVSLPELTRANRSYISILINGRYIKNYQLTKAIIKGYGSKLMVGRFPMAVLAIEMDALLVDVNVHPQKHEVKLSQEQELVALVEQTIRDRLATENLIPDAYQNLHADQLTNSQDFVMELRDAMSNRPTAIQVSQPAVTSSAMPISAAAEAQDEQAGLSSAASDVADEPTVITIASRSALANPTVQEFAHRYEEHNTDLEPFAEGGQRQAGAQTRLDWQTETENAANAGQPRFPELSYIGQMHGTFLFAQGEDGLYLIDQHAAQERVKYEYYREAIGQVDLELQQMLVPIVLEYPTLDMLKIEQHQKDLAAVGLHLEPFGDNAVIVREHPGWFTTGQEEATIREMVDWLLSNDHLTVAEFRERTAIMMSCKQSIKANHAINDFEARGLIEQLAQTENPFNCPHGRPVLVHFSLQDMEKMFKRIQDSHGSWIEYDGHPF